jgi:carboxypeptidase family protein/TonB-dependent receptor-like protein
MKGMKLAVLLLLAAPALVSAQATGTITGVVSDETGALMPAAAVEATNQATGQTRSAVSGSDGFYTLPLLPPGLYRVSATLSGFAPLTRDRIRVVVSETARVDIRLKVGQVAENVVVVGEAPLIETSNATLGIAIDEKKVVDLPLNGRNFTQLGTLIPGVVAPPANLGGQAGDATPGGFGNATGGFSVNGMRPQSNNFLMDGATNNDSFNTGFVLRPPPDAIQEFKILTHSYNAEYGRNAGSVVNVVTRSGSNAWRGSAWEFHRNDALEARNFFAPKDRPKPELDQHQFGAGLGGPIVKNKLFVFGYYEGYRNQRGTTVTSVVMTDAQRGGNFAGGGAIRDPRTGQPFPGNVIPADRLEPIAVRLLRDFIPSPNTGANRFTDSPTVEDDRNQIGLRFDYRISDQHSILGRYLRSGRQQTDPTSPSIFSPAGNNQKATLQDYMASDTYMFSSRAINVARIAFNEIDADPTVTSGETNDGFGWAVENRNPAAVGLPSMGVTGFFTLGDAQQPFAKRINRVLQFTDEFTFLSGRHSWKMGVDVRREQIQLAFINRPNGDFTFNGQYTGNAAADFLLGLPAQFRQGGGDPLMDGTSMQYAAFLQDEFRLSPRLTVNLGLRYELARPFYEKDDKLNTFRPGEQSVRFPAAPAGLLYPGDPGIPRGTYEADKNNVAPRVGVAWDPTGSGKTSVRAAWGLFYDLVPGQGDFFQAGTLAPPFQPLTEVNFPTTSPDPHFRDPLAGLASGPAGFPPGLIFIGWGSDFETPYAHHYNLTVQRQVGENVGVEVGYVGSRGFNMPMFLEVNPTTPILTAPARRGARLYPAYSLVRPTFSDAKSWYDSLQASVRMRPTRGLNFLASYTWGHAIDHISGLNIGNADQLRPILPVRQDDPSTIEAALAREKGDALFDVRHRFVLSFGWELPRLEGRGGLARHVLGGWQVNGIFQKQTGFPLTVYDTVDVALMALPNRPNQVCDPNADAPHTVEQWFDTACFQRLTVAANAGQIGDAGRNTVRGPGLVRTDLSVFKNFPVVREHKLQVRVEAFNLFNQARFGQPGAIIGSPVFGVITAAEEGRIVQLGLRYSF